MKGIRYWENRDGGALIEGRLIKERVKDKL